MREKKTKLKTCLCFTGVKAASQILSSLILIGKEATAKRVNISENLFLSL